MQSKKFPDVLIHKSLQGSLVLPDVIVNTSTLLKRFCPHRMYELHSTGEVVQEVTCDLHSWKWDKFGLPINNDRNLGCGGVTVGKSGLVLRNFTEPEHRWVDIIGAEDNLQFEKCFVGHSDSSWLWLMDLEADYLHVKAGVVHPMLSKQIDVSEIVLEEGDGWIYQAHSPGWFAIYIYPFIFIEHKDGCLGLNRVVPKNDTEFGYTWTTHFYFDYTKTSKEDRDLFMSMEDVFREDVQVAEKIKGKFFPLMKSSDFLEKHSVHFGEWVRNARSQ